MPVLPRNEAITDEMIKTLAARAWFVFQVNTMDTSGYEGFEGNDWDVAGEGVDVLDEIIAAYTKFPRVRILLDFGGLIEDPQQVLVGNVEDLKAAYIEIWGNVNRPNVWGSFPPDW